MKCTCDSRDLFNFGCRCGSTKLEKVTKLEVNEKLDIGSMHPIHLMSLPHLDNKLVTLFDLNAALRKAYPKSGEYMIEDLASLLWKNLQ